MNKNKLNSQEEQVNDIIDRISLITGKSFPLAVTSALIEKIIEMRASSEPESSIKKVISRVTGIAADNPKIEEIIYEIEERPGSNTYTPFNNSLFAGLKARLEKE